MAYRTNSGILPPSPLLISQHNNNSQSQSCNKTTTTTTSPHYYYNNNKNKKKKKKQQQSHYCCSLIPTSLQSTKIPLFTTSHILQISPINIIFTRQYYCKALPHSSLANSQLGIAEDAESGQKLVCMYVKSGDLDEGKRVFNGIPKEKKTVFLWNMIMNEYAKIGEYEDSISFFSEMINQGFAPDSYSITCVLKCFAALRINLGGELIHGLLIKSGCDSFVTVGNALISCYAKCGRVEEARYVFDEMTEKDVITWNSLIGGFLSNGSNSEGIGLLRIMRRSGGGVRLDVATMAIMLPVCSQFGWILTAKELHAYAFRFGFEEETRLSNCLLDTYGKCGCLDYTVRVFNRMTRKNVVSWTSMVACYARSGQMEKAMDLFNEMETTSGVRPDLHAITTVIHACSSCGSLEHGRGVHDYIRKRGLDTKLFVANALMDMYAKCGCMSDARGIFNGMKRRDTVSWNTIIGGYSKNRLPNEALPLLREMQNEKTKPNGVTMACSLPACASLSSLERGMEIHGSIIRHELLLSDGLFLDNALIDMYVKSGALKLAKLIFDRMVKRNLVTWTVMIGGYGMHGHGKEAIAFFHQMQEAGIKPDEVSFIALLYACSHSGLVDEGWRFFNSMRYEYKIVPKLEHYACMVDVLGRAGHLSRAHELIKLMPIEPDATVWGALLCACRLHRDVKLAEQVAERVFELEPENTGYYVLLANIYAEADKWEEMKKLRTKIGKERLRKSPGCSWIEIKGTIHIFVARDGSKPDSNKIHMLLEKVLARMKQEGYVPDRRYALVDLDEEGKDEALCGHSEKLAIAYGLLNSVRGKPIRVIKNLRVCGDCHEVAKFVSRSFGREIILRDSNRFHQFRDGRCSCRDCW